MLIFIALLSFDAFFAIFERKVRHGYTMQYLFNLFDSYAVLIYFYIELVEFCDVINIKDVKWGFRYFENVKDRPALN